MYVIMLVYLLFFELIWSILRGNSLFNLSKFKIRIIALRIDTSGGGVNFGAFVH